jgi:hypothetical protein
MSWLSKIFGSSEKAGKAEVSTGLKADEKIEKEKTLSSETGIPSFKRRNIDFGYSKSYTMTVRDCPKCNATLEQNYADLVYATKNGEIKSVVSSAGYFCPSCPTFVVDEKALALESGNPDEFDVTVAIDEFKPITFKTFDEENLQYAYDSGKKVSKMKFVDSIPAKNRVVKSDDSTEEDEKEKKGERKKPSPTEVRKKKKSRSIANKTKRANRKG